MDWTTTWTNYVNKAVYGEKHKNYPIREGRDTMTWMLRTPAEGEMIEGWGALDKTYVKKVIDNYSEPIDRVAYGYEGKLSLNGVRPAIWLELN